MLEVCKLQVASQKCDHCVFHDMQEYRQTERTYKQLFLLTENCRNTGESCQLLCAHRCFFQKLHVQLSEQLNLKLCSSVLRKDVQNFLTAQLQYYKNVNATDIKSETEHLILHTMIIIVSHKKCSSFSLSVITHKYSTFTVFFISSPSKYLDMT